jgi:two-component system sensor histidine kinase KdpD
MASSLEDHKIDVVVPNSLPDVEVDPVLMGQVLVNLLDNAIRHAPANSVITVKGERRGHEVVMSVADTGPGVPVADRETIFDRFVSLSTGGRAGLGLTIAKTFVEAHGERVWYEEVAGGGARFVVSLPSALGAGR